MKTETEKKTGTLKDHNIDFFPKQVWYVIQKRLFSW